MKERRVPIASLGECRTKSPLERSTVAGDGMGRFVPDDMLVRHCLELRPDVDDDGLLFEKAGARQTLFFDPVQTKAAIVTCGGLCPGLNDVIRSVFAELHHNYGVPDVLGIRHGYMGLNPQLEPKPVRLTDEMVDGINQLGGTVLGSSRGPQDPAAIVDFLQDNRIDMLFCVGGDGTQRGAHAIYEETARRRAPIAIVGIPKTIDNDIAYCEQSFGLITAVEMAQRVLSCAHVEATGAQNGIGLVKVMGRAAGFIAAGATLASQLVDFTLIPEVPFALAGETGFLAALKDRVLDAGHALVVVAEGAGQELFDAADEGRDASGNRRQKDIGLLLKSEIGSYFAKRNVPVSVKYIDPSYIVRSVPANCEDSILCDQYARRAVHAAMAGKTDVLICSVHCTFVHVPISLATSSEHRVEPEGELWTRVLSSTGQPRRMA